MSKINSGTLVQFKPSYNGYFRDLKDKTLMINQVFKRETRDSTDSDKVTIVSIDEVHLISVTWFNVVEIKQTELA